MILVVQVTQLRPGELQGVSDPFVERGLKLVGVDYLSVESFEAEPNHPTHGILLGARVGVIEGLNLHNVAPGTYRLICLPLKLVGSDGAPARAVLEY